MRLRARPPALATSLVLLLAPAAADAQAPAEPAPAPSSPRTGGAEYGAPPPVFQPTVPGAVAVLKDGIAYAPADAPDAVKAAIWAGNELQDKPYVYGGGHNARAAQDRGYDCSGTVSYVLRAAGLLRRPRDSSSFMRYGAGGLGRWITIYTNPGHAYVVIAGLRLDTSAAGVGRAADARARQKGPRWRPTLRQTRGYKVRHPIGF